MIRSLVFLLSLAVISAALLLGANRLFETPPSWGIATVIFLAATTFAVFAYLHRKNDPEKFTQIYLLSITLKILLSCVFVIVFILSDRPGADYNAIFFMIAYVIFTALEVVFLLLKKIS